MSETVVVRDERARSRVAAYFSWVGLLIVGIILTIPLMAIYYDRITTEGSSGIPILATMILTVAMELIVIGGALWYTGMLKRAAEALRLKNFSLANLTLGAGIGLLFFLGLLGLEALSRTLGIPVEDSKTSGQFALTHGLEKVILLFGFVALIVPICEELLFRGYVLGFLLRGHSIADEHWKSKMGVWAIFFSSAFFSLLHFQGFATPTDFIVLLWTFAFACVSSVLFITRKSIYPSMAAHIYYNLCSAIVIFYS